MTIELKFLLILLAHQFAKTMISGNSISENPYASFRIADGILFCSYKPKVVLTFKVAHLVVADRLRFQNEKSFPIFCDMRGVIGTEKEGRDYLAQYGSSLTTAVALWAQHKVVDLIGSFYVNINKPHTPTLFFTSRTEALTYLQPFK